MLMLIDLWATKSLSLCSSCYAKRLKTEERDNLQVVIRPQTSNGFPGALRWSHQLDLCTQIHRHWRHLPRLNEYLSQSWIKSREEEVRKTEYRIDKYMFQVKMEGRSEKWKSTYLLTSGIDDCNLTKCSISSLALPASTFYGKKF